jgi:thioredoxin-like negative regulator of GroEL
MPPPAAEPSGPEDVRPLARGRQAFAAQEYGRAAQRFRQAVAAAPREALPHFLLAQALFALGKYGEAVDAILAGMALRPDWPATRFRPRELYGSHAADYSRHLERLEQTLARHPDDPDLLFLYAYQLWFDGRKDEARLLFERALPRAADPGVINRFLRALPAAPTV